LDSFKSQTQDVLMQRINMNSIVSVQNSFENDFTKAFIRKTILKHQLEIGLYNGTACSQFQKNKPVLGHKFIINGRIYSSIRKATKG
jgi:hypothetical protein